VNSQNLPIFDVYVKDQPQNEAEKLHIGQFFDDFLDSYS